MFSHNQKHALLLNWPCLNSSRELILRISNLVFADWKRAENDLQRYSGCTGQAPDPRCINGRVQGFLLQDVSFCPEDEEDAHLCLPLTDCNSQILFLKTYRFSWASFKIRRFRPVHNYQHLSVHLSDSLSSVPLCCGFLLAYDDTVLFKCVTIGVLDIQWVMWRMDSVSQEGRLPQVPGRVRYRKRQEAGGGEQSDGVQSC